MNCMKEVADALGVQFGEVFEINNKLCEYMLTEDGLYKLPDKYDKYNIRPVNANDFLGMLVAGDVGIVKKRFKPRKGQKYYQVYFDDKSISTTFVIWRGDETDYANYRTENCFKTEEQAEKNKYCIYRILTGRAWKE